MADPRGPELAAGRLLELAVVDLALIERVRITFAAGFNVLTGETGAGKSLLIDALGLALGARADPGLVRHGAEAARVEVLFDRIPEALVCVREVGANGRSVARVDDETVTAGRLASVAGPLVEIHGQREQGRLLDERWQRELLDGYGGSHRGPLGGARDRPAGAGAPDRAPGARSRGDRGRQAGYRRGGRDPGPPRRVTSRRGHRARVRGAGRAARR